jgi:hypothetical protein
LSNELELELHVNDEFYASASGPREEVIAEIKRYWATCSGDGKCSVYEVTRTQISISDLYGLSVETTVDPLLEPFNASGPATRTPLWKRDTCHHEGCINPPVDGLRCRVHK